MTSRQDLHQLLDQLPEAELHVARRFLEFLRGHHDDPFLRTLAEALEDDEPAGAEEAEAVREATEDCVSARVRSWQEVRREFGNERCRKPAMRIC